MAVKASDFVKKAKKDDKSAGKKNAKTSLLDWIGNRRNAAKKAAKGEDDHDE